MSTADLTSWDSRLRFTLLVMKQNCRFSLALYAIVFSLYATGSAWAQSTPPPHAASVIDAMPHAKQIDQASISPDGTQVAYIMGGELALLPSSGGRARTIAVEGKLALRDLCWSRDSSQIAFIADLGG